MAVIAVGIAFGRDEAKQNIGDVLVSSQNERQFSPFRRPPLASLAGNGLDQLQS